MNSSGPVPWQNPPRGAISGCNCGKKWSSRKEEFCRTKEQPTMIFPFGGNPSVVQHTNEARAFMDAISTGQNSVEATAEMSGLRQVGCRASPVAGQQPVSMKPPPPSRSLTRPHPTHQSMQFSSCPPQFCWRTGT